MTLPDILIWITPERLSDGSIVYNVDLPEQKLAATDENAARELAETIVDAINEHTTHVADKMDG